MISGLTVMRQILRFQASQHNRHIIETWEVIQLGLGGALLATSVLTAHRSRVIISFARSFMFSMVLCHVLLSDADP